MTGEDQTFERRVYEVEKPIKDCPYHSGVIAEIESVCRRCDEFKVDEGKSWQAMDSMREDCKAMRETCHDALFNEISARPMTKTLLTIIGLALTVMIVIGGYYSHTQSKAMENLAQKDADLEKKNEELKKQIHTDRKELNEDIADIKGVLVEVKTVMKILAKGKVDDSLWKRNYP